MRLSDEALNVFGGGSWVEMDRHEIETSMEAAVDRLAAIEHQRWAHWQRYMHDQGERRADGALVLPAELVRRWESQIRARFEDLSPAEQESDREQVRRYLPLIVETLTSRFNRT